MCGIAGIVSAPQRPDQQPPLRDLLSRMLWLLRHRGPDGQGHLYATDERAPAHAFIGHRRLAILSPGPEAQQPMSTVDGRYTLSFNGAIYNFVELADELDLPSTLRRSDTAVLLHAWAHLGPACLPRLNGMFAFAIWDAHEHTLHLARDRFGEKPLFYVTGSKPSFPTLRLAFASEIKALLATGLSTADLDLGQLCEFLATHDIDHHVGRTLFVQARAVPPGCFLRLDGDARLTVQRYYSLPPPSRERSMDGAGEAGQTLVAEATELLRDAVRLRLRSDVPLAGSLSGGLDSSLITALAIEAQRQPGPHVSPLPYPLFSCQFPGAERDGDETRWVERVQTHLHLRDLHIVSPTATDLLGSLDTILYHQEAPFADTSIVSHFAMVQAAQAHGIKVLLSGQGGDEVFIGYPGYQHALMATLLHHGQLRDLLHTALARRDAAAAGLWQQLQATLYHALPDRLHQAVYALRRQGALPLSPDGKRRLQDAPARFSDLLPALCSGSPDRWSRFDRYVCDSIERFSLPHILRHDDRNSMAVGIESRAPYLDHRLLTLMHSVDEASLLRDGTSKRILRAVARDRLPEALCQRRDKRGFFSPQRDWLWHPACEARVRDRCARLPAPLDGLLDSRRLQHLIQRFYADRQGNLAGAVWLAWVSAEFVGSTLPRLLCGDAPQPPPTLETVSGFPR